MVAERFASDLAARLADGRMQGAFQDIAIVASPSFLGKLRAALDEPTRRMVTQEEALVLQDPSPERVKAALDFKD